uniref:Uncharacterized protein n=1 Tax=Onchocerca volvulus TaxID=6282 RepID=A0A8R1TVU8_ONCVO
LEVKNNFNCIAAQTVYNDIFYCLENKLTFGLEHTKQHDGISRKKKASKGRQSDPYIKYIKCELHN